MKDVLIAGLVFVSSSVMQQDTSLTEIEKMLVEPSLVSSLEKMDLSTVEKARDILEPLALGTGLLLWLTRNFKEYSSKQSKDKANSNSKNHVTKQVKNEDSDVLSNSRDHDKTIFNAIKDWQNVR